MLTKLAVVLLILSFNFAAFGQCRVLEERTFVPQNKRVRLVNRRAGARDDGRIVFFSTSLRVNTDGAPNSYHPRDLRGGEMAINNICNGVAVYRNLRGGRRTALGCAEARRIFEQFRDNGWRVPAGYTISWQNVLAARTESGRRVPCVFQGGEFRGYFGSLTSLKNDLPDAEAGECGSKNQLDQRIIPAFVMPGGANPLRDFGAAVGDLLFVFNPQNNAMSAAIIGDVGPASKLGEGSVGLNMALLRRTVQPKTYAEALRLDTGTSQMLVAVIPGSKSFQPRKPFTSENISERVDNWITQAGFTSRENFIDFLRSCNR
jgi:hypothetical protein